MVLTLNTGVQNIEETGYINWATQTSFKKNTVHESSLDHQGWVKCKTEYGARHFRKEQKLKISSYLCLKSVQFFIQHMLLKDLV